MKSTFPSIADVEARLRTLDPPPAAPTSEAFRSELETQGDAYGALLARLADKVVSIAAKRRGTAETRTAAFAPVTIRIAKRDVPIAMVGALLGSGGSFNAGLEAVINARLAAMGSSETAQVRGGLAFSRPSVTVSIDVPAPAVPTRVDTPAPPAVPAAPWIPPSRAPDAKTTYHAITSDYAPHRHAIEACVDAVLDYWSPEAIAKDFGITHDELLFFRRQDTLLPYGTTRGMLHRILETIQLRDCVSHDSPTVDPAELTAAIAALGEPATPTDTKPLTTCTAMAIGLREHGPVLKACVAAALTVPVDFNKRFGVEPGKLAGFYRGTQAIERTEAIGLARKILTAVRDRSIYDGIVTFTPSQITAALAALDKLPESR